MGASSTGAGGAFAVAVAEGIDPADFRQQAQHLPESQQDADQKHAEDKPVEARIGGEERMDLPYQDRAQKGHDDKEDHHGQDDDARARQSIGVVVASLVQSFPRKSQIAHAFRSVAGCLMRSLLH